MYKHMTKILLVFVLGLMVTNCSTYKMKSDFAMKYMHRSKTEKVISMEELEVEKKEQKESGMMQLRIDAN